MALPASGQISMSQVNTELGLSASAQISFNDAAVRTLFSVASGAISMSNGYGKANAFLATISSNQQQLNLRTWALANGWNGSSAATITVGSGVYIWSDDTSIAGLTIDGSWPGGITLVNNGFIMGKGGSGAGRTNSGVHLWAQSGGNAISLGTNVSINSSASYIGGGGGGGGMVYGDANGNAVTWSGGGGAGGGPGGGAYSYASGYISPALGGSVGNVGGNGAAPAKGLTSGGGGGRIMPGVGGAGGTFSGSTQWGTGGGAGGGGCVMSLCGFTSTNGSSGGSGSNAAQAPTIGGSGSWGGSGGGGGYGAMGANAANASAHSSSSGNSGGKAISLNGYTVTWAGGFPSSYVFGAVS